jgi:polyhydroxybutyrate depolymerase
VDWQERVSRTVASCADDSMVVEYRVADMGHTWPRYLAGPDLVNDVIWEFFSTHARPA